MTIDELFLAAAKYGVKRITLAMDDKGQPAVFCEQRVYGIKATSMIQHQCVGANHDEAAREMIRLAIVSGAAANPSVLPLECE